MPVWGAPLVSVIVAITAIATVTVVIIVSASSTVLTNQTCHSLTDMTCATFKVGQTGSFAVDRRYVHIPRS